MIIILHSENMPLSREYVAKYTDNVIVISWYEDPDAVRNYRMAHNPEVSAFPSVCVDGKLWRVEDISQSPDWIRDEFTGKHLTDQQKIDRLTAVKKLDVVRALSAMGQLDILLNFLNDSANATFKLLWDVAIEIELNDADTQAALQSLNIDISEVKKQILGL